MAYRVPCIQGAIGTWKIVVIILFIYYLILIVFWEDDNILFNLILIGLFWVFYKYGLMFRLRSSNSPIKTLFLLQEILMERASIMYFKLLLLGILLLHSSAGNIFLSFPRLCRLLLCTLCIDEFYDVHLVTISMKYKKLTIQTLTISIYTWFCNEFRK